jgi:hypothetical protein
MKTTNKKRGVGLGIFSIGFILFFIAFVSAFSVGMPYMENKQLYLSPGAITDIEFVLQNSGGTENINARATIIEGSEIIEITDTSNIYVVIPGQQTKVNFKITIPEDAQIGDSYHIKLGFAAEAGAGSFAFGSEIEQNFDVFIGERAVDIAGEAVGEEEEETQLKSLLVYGIIILVLIAIIIIFFVIKRKNKT